MEWGAHGERNHSLGASRFRQFTGAGNGVGMPGNHDLTRRIQVRRRHDAAGKFLARRCARLRHERLVSTENRGHRANANRHGFLHELPAAADGPQRVGEG